MYEIISRKDGVYFEEKIDEMIARGLPFTSNERVARGLSVTLDEIRLYEQFAAYIKDRRDPQAEIFSDIIRNMCYVTYDMRRVETDLIDNALERALEMGDKYIQVSVFKLYGRIQECLGNDEKALFYYIRCAGLLKEIEWPRFTKVDYLSFDIARLLYLKNEFRNCVNYAREGTKGIEDERSVFNGLPKIYLYDILGAAYKELGKNDSTIYYYSEIRKELRDNSSAYTTYSRRLWHSIAEGRIGDCYLDQGKTDQAEPMLKYYLETSRELSDSLNIALSKNSYAKLQFIKGNYRDALHFWKDILHDPQVRQHKQLLMKVSSGMVQVYRHLNEVEQALYFQQVTDSCRQAIIKEQYQSGLKSVQNEYAFMKMSDNVAQMNTKLAQMKQTRNFIIIVVLLVAVVIVLWLNRRSAKLEHEVERQKYIRLLADQELDAAKSRLEAMTKNLLEKSQFVQSLISKVEYLEQSQDVSRLLSDLNNFGLTSYSGWEAFKSAFLKVHPHFINNLQQRFPHLSSAEIRIAMLVYLKLDNPEIANLLGISASSVATAKFRLKNKLDLEASTSLAGFIEKF